MRRYLPMLLLKASAHSYRYHCHILGKSGLEIGAISMDLRGYFQQGCHPNPPAPSSDRAGNCVGRIGWGPGGEGQGRHVSSADVALHWLFPMPGHSSRAGAGALRPFNQVPARMSLSERPATVPPTLLHQLHLSKCFKPCRCFLH